MNRNPYVSAAVIKMAEALDLLDKGKVHGPPVDRLRDAVNGLHQSNGKPPVDADGLADLLSAMWGGR